MTGTLVADIGGTNARFAWVDASGVHDEKVLKVGDYPGPVEAARAYLDAIDAPAPRVATFAVAGPVARGADRFTLTNHPWTFSIEATRKALNLDSFDLINDFHAMALGVLAVDRAQVRQIGGGQADPQGNIGVIGPGTGLGMASLIWDADTARYIPLPGEGGHATVPVATDREWALVKWLLDNKYHHVSLERFCSGKGLVNLYNAINGVDGKVAQDLSPEDISARALDGSCPSCAEAVDTMLAFLGRMAGNLALTNNTAGGIYLCGGILPKLGMDKLETSRLRAEFTAKGRFSDYMQAIPSFVVTDYFLPLKGLHLHANRHG